jgi:hypothetical protein
VQRNTTFPDDLACPAKLGLASLALEMTAAAIPFNSVPTSSLWAFLGCPSNLPLCTFFVFTGFEFGFLSLLFGLFSLLCYALEEPHGSFSLLQLDLFFRIIDSLKMGAD